LGFPSEAGEPPKLLKGFQKIGLKPGQEQTVEFNLRDRDLSIWNSDTHSWQKQTGDFIVYVGSSSRDIRAQTKVHVMSKAEEEAKKKEKEAALQK